MAQSIGPTLRRQWQFFSRLPGGKWLFSRLLGLAVPYSGSLHATVQKLEPGVCIASLKDRRRVRNHLHSVHAMALCNLAELVTGLALLNGLPAGARGILKGFEIDYQKKSRGLLIAECRCEVPEGIAEREYRLTVRIRDRDGEVTVVARANWLIGPEVKQS